MRTSMPSAAACALALLFAGCATARMPLPSELASAERLAVTGRQGWKMNEHLRFGAWEAADVDRSWIRGSDIRFQQLERNRRRESFSWVLREGGQERARARCEAVLLVQGVNLPAGVRLDPDDRSSLTCTITPTAGGGPWRMDLTEERERPLSGVLTGPVGEIAVVGTNRLEGGVVGAGFTTGYRLERAGRPLAAVEVMDDGAVWLRPDAEAAERPALAAAAAALLLLSDLREALDEG